MEVRKAAGLSDSDQAYFEEKMSGLAAEAEYYEFKSVSINNILILSCVFYVYWII